MPALNSYTTKNSLKGEFLIEDNSSADKRKSTKTLKPPIDIKNGENILTSTENKANIESQQGQKIGAFTSLAINPDGISFKDQKEGEEIILAIRRHFATNISWIFQAIILAIIPIVAVPLIPVFLPILKVSAITQTAFIFLYYLSLFAFLLINFTSWYFNLGIVTNERIIDIDTSGILYRKVSETTINLVQDITQTQEGVFASFFNYGDVFIQTAGENPNFEFDKAPEPSTIRHVIGQLIGK